MHITVCIATRNRGPSIATTLRSLAASDYDDFDVIIVDQSTTDETAQAVREVTASDARFTYIRSQSVGLSVARNIGIAHARGGIIACTDDDCEVIPEWLSLLVGYFSQYPAVGEICGEVRAAPYDYLAGYIPMFKVRALEVISSPWVKWRARGIGANMAFRCEVLDKVGPFDEVLGAGGPLYSCEDGDMTYRVLKAGYSVLNAPDAYVIHSGFRTWAEAQPVMRHALLSVSACCMKHIRLGDLAMVPTFFYIWFGRCLSWKNLFLLRKNPGIGRFLSYGWGIVLGFRYRIDRRRRVFIPPQKRPAAPAKASEPLLSATDEKAVSAK